MRVIVAHGAEDLRVETQTIDEPGPGEALIQMEAGGICGSDLHYYHWAARRDFAVAALWFMRLLLCGDAEPLYRYAFLRLSNALSAYSRSFQRDAGR